MSSMGNSNGGRPIFGNVPRPQPSQGQQQAQMDFNNRDPWNNPQRQQQPAQQMQQQNGQNGQDGNNQQQNRNDAGIDESVIDKIWEQQKPNNQQQQQQPQNNQQQQQPIDPAVQMTNYLKSVGLDPIVLTDADREKISQGDLSGLIDQFNTKLVNAHTKALSGSKTMIDEAVTRAVQEATRNAQAQTLGHMSLQSLHNSLPWTKDKAIAPMAQTIMQRFLDKGYNTEDAIGGVKQYFAYMSAKSAGDDDGVNRGRNGNFGSNGNGRESRYVPEGGWMSILGSGGTE